MPPQPPSSSIVTVRALEALWDRDAEITVLAYAMLDPHTLQGDSASRLTASDFHDPDTRAVFDAIQRVVASGRMPMPHTVVPELKPVVDLQLPDYFRLEEWKCRAVFTPEAEAMAERMLKFSERRSLVSSLEAALRMVHSGDSISKPLGMTTLAVQGHFNQLATLAKDVDEFDAETLEQVDCSGDQFLVDGVLQDSGINLLMGEGGVGKSVAALDLAIRVLSGGSSFGGIVNRSGAVLYLGADVDVRTMKQRLHRMRLAAGCTDGLPGFLYVRAPLDFSDPAAFAFIAHKVRAVANQHPDGKTALVIVDSLASYLFNLDENAAGDMGLVMNQVRLLSERSGASILLVHHTNKNELATGSNRGRGSTVLPNGSDCVLHMVRKGTTVVVTQTKNRNASPMTPLAYGIEDTEDGGLMARFLPASASDVGEVMVDLCVNELARLAKDSEGEPLGRKEMFLALDACGHFSFKTKERAWAALKILPGYTFGKNGRSMAVVYHEQE